jgi:hypothetical protein
MEPLIVGLPVYNTVPRIMGKMPYADWKEWATKRPERMQEDLGPMFEKFVERKWQDALNVAAAEPQPGGQRGKKPPRVKQQRKRHLKATRGPTRQ